MDLLMSPCIGNPLIPDQTRADRLTISFLRWQKQQFQRPGVVYREISADTGKGQSKALPRCETSLVWSAQASPALTRFRAFVEAEQG